MFCKIRGTSVEIRDCYNIYNCLEFYEKVVHAAMNGLEGIVETVSGRTYQIVNDGDEWSYHYVELY